MTNDEVRRVMARIEERRQQQRAELAAAARPPVDAGARLGLTHAPGDRVFDTVSGQEGEVLHGTRENVVDNPPNR